MSKRSLFTPEFYQGNLVNDLALIKFDQPIDLHSSPHISAVCLPETYENMIGQRCWVTGWGKNSFGQVGEYQSVLKEVDVPIVSPGECEHSLRTTRLGQYYQLHPGFLCAGGEGGKDACEGDGGSPLVCETGSGSWKVAGLVSWGIGCGQPGVPGVYANVAYYRNWIDSMMARYGTDMLRSSSTMTSPQPIYGNFIQERSNNGNEDRHQFFRKGRKVTQSKSAIRIDHECPLKPDQVNQQRLPPPIEYMAVNINL